MRGVRVVALSQYIASSLTATLMADLGAEVIKVEAPSRPDPARGLLGNPGSLGGFPENRAGRDWWNRSSFYNVLNRGQRSLTLDLKSDTGREVFFDLMRQSDVLIESFPPPVSMRLGIVYEQVSRVNPRVVMASVSGFGHGPGPYTSFKGAATSMEATHGHCTVTGYRDGPPSKASRSFIDYIVAWWTLFAIVGSLRDRAATGRGRWIDSSLYECGAALLPEFMLAEARGWMASQRVGNRDLTSAPQGCYPCEGDDQWIAISVDSDDSWNALQRIVGVERFVGDHGYSTAERRQAHHDSLDTAIAAWTAGKDKFEAFDELQQAGISAGPVLDARELHDCQQLSARGVIPPVAYPAESDIGTRRLLGHPWLYDGMRPSSGRPAPALGEANDYLLKEVLGRTDAQIAALRAAGVVADAPDDLSPPPVPSLSDLVRSGVLMAYDPGYADD